MEKPDSDLIKFYGKIFAQNYKLPSCQSFTAVFGHKSCGKSVFIDYLAGKELILYCDPQLDLDVVVQSNNCEAQYPAIYISEKNKSMLLLEGFILDQSDLVSSTEILKLVFLRQFIEQSKKAAFVILVEENQKERILFHMEYFLKCMGITEDHKNLSIDLLKEHVYIIVSKTEEGQFEDAKEIIEELAQNQCQDVNVRQIIKHVISKGRIIEFRSQKPSQNLAKQISQKFAPKTYDSKGLLSLLDRSVLKQKTGIFSEEQQKKVLETFEKTAKLINYLILYASNEDRPSQRQYQKLAKDLYPDKKSRNEIRTMLGKFSRTDMQSLNLQPKINVLKDKGITLKSVAEVVIDLINTLQRYSEARPDYQQIAGKLVFLQNVANWLKTQQVGAKAREIADFLVNNLQKVQQNYEKSRSQSSKSKPEAPVAKGKPGKTPVAKKGSAALKAFYQALEQKCKNNRDAIILCLSAIKQKQKQANFDYYQVVYYIRLLKDLLQDFESKSTSDRQLFIKELIQLALYSQNYFDLQNYLKKAIRSMALTFKEARALMITLRQSGKYELCEMLIDYMIAECTDDATFNKLAQLKANIKAEINKEYTGRETEGQREVKKKQLLIDEGSLFGKKNKGSDLEAYLAGNDYERHISVKQ